MRLAPLPPQTLPPEVRPLHDDMVQEIATQLQGFVTQRQDGALIGPFAPMLRFAQFGAPAWAATKALIQGAQLPRPVREVAILATGAVFGSRYELYAHEHVAAQSGLSEDKIAAIAAGQRPADLDDQEMAAYDIATTLAGGRPLAESTYRRALRMFGEAKLAEMIFLIGNYCLVSVLLNAYDMSVPGEEQGLPPD